VFHNAGNKAHLVVATRRNKTSLNTDDKNTWGAYIVVFNTDTQLYSPSNGRDIEVKQTEMFN